MDGGREDGREGRGEEKGQDGRTEGWKDRGRDRPEGGMGLRREEKGNGENGEQKEHFGSSWLSMEQASDVNRTAIFMAVDYSWLTVLILI